jgi:hypothetical protein
MPNPIHLPIGKKYIEEYHHLPTRIAPGVEEGLLADELKLSTEILG